MADGILVKGGAAAGRGICGLVALVLAALTFGQPAVAADHPCGSVRPEAPAGVTARAISRHLDADERVRILAVGSSSTEGVGASSSALSYPAQLERDLRAAWPADRVEVANAGIGGETADETLRRLERLVSAPARPDLVLWQVGTNDAVRGGDERLFRSMLERGIAAARAAGAELVLVDQQYFPAIADVARYERYVAIVAATAAEHGVPVFSRYALMKRSPPDLLQGMLSADRFHMGDRGYACLARVLGDTVVEAAARSTGTVAEAPGRPVALALRGR